MATQRETYKVVLFFAAMVLLAVTAVLMILLGHTPQIYQPPVVPPSGQISPYLTHKLGPDFFASLQLEQPFELVLEQQGVNEIFASTAGVLALGEITLSRPVAVFYPDSVVLMAAVGLGGASSVLSITAQPAIDENGRLNLNIRSVTLGAIPVMSFARKIAQQYADQYLSADDGQEIVAIVNGILDNRPFEPVLTISKYTIRLRKLTLEAGRLTLLIEPVKKTGDIRGTHVP